MDKITDSFIGKTHQEIAEIKAVEVSKVPLSGRRSEGEFEVEVIKISKIDGGVQVLARAWKNGKQLGFGKDGSVDIERFRFFNPPVLVDDPNGDIERVSVNSEGVIRTRKLKEDASRALQSIVVETIRIVGKEGATIVQGKIGNTTSTFYPGIDGRLSYFGAATWSTARDATDALDTNTTETEQAFARSDGTVANFDCYRSMYNIDTSAIPDTDTISSATFSAHGSTIEAVQDDMSSSMILVSSTPASDTALANADFDQGGTTSFGGIAVSAWNTGAYNDIALNATGLAYISKTGYTNLCAKTELDRANTTPTSTAACRVSSFFSDESGTSKDPKLVVVHSADSGSASPQSGSLLTMGIGA